MNKFLMLCLFHLLDGADSGAGGGGAAPPAAAPAGVPAASPAAGVPAASPAAPAASAVDHNAQQTPAQLRAAYEAAKASLQPWEKLGAKPDEVAAVWQAHTNAVQQANATAAKLGYTPQQVSDAIKELGIVKVSQWLEQQAAKQGPPDPLKALEEKFQKTLEPLLADRNAQQMQATYQKFETATNEAVVTKFGGTEIAKQFPQLVQDVFDYASALMATEPDVVAEVKKGDLKSIAKYVDQAYSRLTASYAKFGEFMQKRAVPDPNKPGNQTPPAAKKRVTLDDIIQGRENAVAAIPSMRSATTQ